MDTQIENKDDILSMILPNQLKKPTMDFLEVEDIHTIRTALPPSKREKEAVLTHEEVIKMDEVERNIPAEEREKTIKCLLKVLDYQLSGVKEQALDIERHYKRIDQELNHFEKHLQEQNYNLILEDVKNKMKATQREADATQGDEEGLFNAAEIIVENKLLID